MTSHGKLYIVATPIGHLADMSFRAIDTLKTVDLILAEDTRHASILLQHYQITNTVKSFHAHNEQKKSETYLNMLQAGKQIALISDAGTPLINDPGFSLVHQARERHLDVIPIPGPSAIITALSASGIPSFQFGFYGFPPVKKKARQDFFQSLFKIPHTLIFYESTHRLQDCLEDMASIFGPNQPMVLAKELSKSFEHFESASIADVLNWLNADLNRYKGEFVLIIPPREHNPCDVEEDTRILNILLPYLSPKQAALATQSITGQSKNRLYELALQLQKD